MAFCPPQKVTDSGLGRSPGSEVQASCGLRLLHLPRRRHYRPACAGLAEWLFEASVLTHSGGTAPDSHRTSLLCPSWAPRQGRELYHVAGGSIQRRELLQAGGTETVVVALLQRGERGFVELDVA